MSLHGVFHKSRVFDPTCLYEAKAKPMIRQKCLFDSYILNYAAVENLSPDNNEKKQAVESSECSTACVKLGNVLFLKDYQSFK